MSKRKLEKNSTDHKNILNFNVIWKDKKFVTILAVVSSLIFICLIWILAESFSGGELKFNNRTNYKIEYITATFMNDDWQISDIMSLENIDAKEKSSLYFGEIDLNNMEATLQIELKFVGYPSFLLDVGYFNDLLSGNINITLNPVNDEDVEIVVHAKNGAIRSKTIDCVENYVIYVKDGYIE